MARIDANVSDWMSKIPENLWETPLSEIAIPGSHDSFSSRIDPSSEIGPDAPAAVRVLGPLAKGILNKWSRTQSLSFKMQLLNFGIRYFDLRVASRNGTQKIHFIHTLYGTSVEEGLDEIIEFLDANKKEIVILDFNHFYEMSEDQHQGFLNMLIEKCGEKLCLFVGMESLTLNMLWENGLQIIIVYHHKIGEEMCHVWPGSACKSYWPETTNIPQMFNCLDKVKLKENGDHFKVCQCVLTPDTKYILGHMNGSVFNDFAKKVMPDVMTWLKQQKRGKCGINVVIADYIELDEFAKTVISLNFQQQVV